MVKRLLISAWLVVMAAPSAQVVLNAQRVSTDLQAPFSETVFYELGDEWLPLAGLIHVHTQITPKGSINVHVNLDGVSGFGETSGIRYITIGGDRAALPFDTSVSEDFDFSIVPADGTILSCILRVRLGLTFNDGGTLTDVTVEQVTVVH